MEKFDFSFLLIFPLTNIKVELIIPVADKNKNIIIIIIAITTE